MVVEEKKIASVLEAMMGGTRNGASHAPEAPRTLADKMYEGHDAHLTMKSRLNARMVGAVARAKTAAKLMDFDPLDAYANILLQLHVSLDGLGRKEAVDMARVTAITQIGGASMDPALDG